MPILFITLFIKWYFTSEKSVIGMKSDWKNKSVYMENLSFEQ